MQVHLIRSEGFPIEDFNHVLNLLNAQRGSISFVPSVPVLLPDADIQHTFDDLDAYTQKKLYATYSLSTHDKISRSFPLTQSVWTWKQLFDVCSSYRKNNNISEDTHVFLLTEHPNDKNWFGSIDQTMKNYFIHTNDWDIYFENGIDKRFPIAYEVVIWLMRSLMFKDQMELLAHIHDQPRGCVMDFCKNKKEIVLKMRTADLCPDCTSHLTKRDIKMSHLKQLFTLMDSIRDHLLFRKRSILLMEPSRMEIRSYAKNIYLTDLGDLQVNLNPKEKALYLLYLNHPKGIPRSHIIDYRDELRSYYAMLSSAVSNAQIDQNIDRLIDITDNNVNEILSKIRRKFKEAIPDQWDIYAITHVGDTHKILLQRELVSFVN
jgi:hypothetical protein